jgi:hypothetical protein
MPVEDRLARLERHPLVGAVDQLEQALDGMG